MNETRSREAAEGAPPLGIEAGRDRLVVALVAFGFLLRLALAWAPFSYLAERGPVIDDAFYSLSVARNLARGAGVTADGFHPTSGFQPLYTLALVPVYRLFPEDRIIPVHIALSILALCGGATGWLVFRIARRLASRPAALFSLFLWTVSPYFLSHGLNGLETGAYGLLVAAVLDQHLGGGGDRRSLLRLGALLGMCVLARVDGLILAAVIVLDLLWSSARWKDALARIVTLATPVALIAFPYFLFLFVRFGSFLPESGAATRLLSLCFGSKFVLRQAPTIYFDPAHPPWAYYLGSLREAILTLGSEPLVFPLSLPLALVSPLELSEGQTTILSLLVACLLPLNLVAFLRGGRGSEVRSRFLRVSLLVALLWIPAYAFGAQGQWWFGRYFYPLFLLMTVAAGLVLDGLKEGSPVLRRWGWPRFWAMAALLELAVFATQAPSRFLVHQRNLNVSSFLGMARVLDRNLPPGARVGAFQSGTLSYFATRPVVNLDGVVNGEASQALREKRMLAYIREERLAAVIDAPFIVDALLVRRSDAREVKALPGIRRVGPSALVLIPDPKAPPPAEGGGR
jgi:hypothetical protein